MSVGNEWPLPDPAAQLLDVIEATDDLSDDERHALSVLREVLA